MPKRSRKNVDQELLAVIKEDGDRPSYIDLVTISKKSTFYIHEGKRWYRGGAISRWSITDDGERRSIRPLIRPPFGPPLESEVIPVLERAKGRFEDWAYSRLTGSLRNPK